MDIKQHISAYPPVVAVLGHVDHGKTTVLDAIRETSMAEREQGGITQGIGASSVGVMHDGTKRSITFIDTPGHEAFSKMRSRGAQAADICLLIISAVDSVKPQTKESIDVLKASSLPFIVVLTKSDLETANPDRVKQDLLKEEVMLEDFGGNVPSITVSAKTKHNIKELLDLILLVFDLQKPSDYAEKIGEDKPLEAIVIESRLDLKAGPRATVVVKNGTISTRDEVYVQGEQFKVRTLVSGMGVHVDEAKVGEAVEILGLKTVPEVGSVIASARQAAVPKMDNSLKKVLEYTPQNTGKVTLTIVLAADTEGSLEAILASLPEDVTIVEQKTGEPTEADVLLAKSTGAIVIGFNIKVRPSVKKLASTEKVVVRNYTIIYELLDELRDVLEGKKLAQEEEVYGVAEVKGKFPFEKSFAYGVSVVDGRVAKGDKIRVMRRDDAVGEATITSLRVGKDPTSKVEKNHEAGIVVSGSLDIQMGDVILSHN